MPSDDAIAGVIEQLALARGPAASFCPSEAARALAGDAGWRALMPRVREAAARLQAAGRIEVTQRGQAVAMAQVRGPVRLRLAAGEGGRC